MLNITTPVVLSQPNQITPVTSVASRHGPAFRPAARLMLILPQPWEQGRVSLDLRRLIGIPLWARAVYEKKDGFLKRRFLTDKGPFAIGIKEVLLMNHRRVRECSWKEARVGCYARLERWYVPERHGEFTQGGVELWAERDQDKARGMQNCLIPQQWIVYIDFHLLLCNRLSFAAQLLPAVGKAESALFSFLFSSHFIPVITNQFL